MNVSELQASLLLNAIKEIGPARFQNLISKFGSAQQIISEGMDAWAGLPLFDPDTLARIRLDYEEARKRADADMKQIEKLKIRLYLWQEGPYPALLRQISHAPPVLYVAGEDIITERPAVALVGSRRCSFYGEKMARLISADLAHAGVTTVSGLARGIDTHVHKTTLECGGKTWAVVGSGLAKMYPPENRSLAQAIEKNGAVISEFPMDTMPFPANFPRRNRIIAGLCRGTLVIEGTEKSGSLITARLAAEEGRDVFALPGPVTSALSAAPHLLLKMGAALVQSADDILREIGLVTSAERISAETAVEHAEVYGPMLSLLSEEPVQKEVLADRLKVNAPALSALLLEMELKGLVRMVPGGSVIKT